jgi:hypothetical protein
MAIIVGWLRRGSLSNLAQIRLKKAYLAIVALLIKLLIENAGILHLAWILKWTLLLQWLIYSLLFIFMVLNWNVPGMKWFALGSLLNLIPIALNQGAMPVNVTGLNPELASMIQNGAWATHKPIDSNTALWLLSDIIFFPWPTPQRMSIGDGFLCLGILVFVVKAMGTRYSYRVTRVIE